MTARWRTVLRLRALLTLLIEQLVPLGRLGDCIEQVGKLDDAALVDAGPRVPSLSAGLARELVNAMLGDDVELIDRDTWHGQREKWRDLIEHIRERYAAVLADEGLLCASAIATELHDLIGWIGQVQPDPRPPGEPRDLLRISDELRRLRRLASNGPDAVTQLLDGLLAFTLPLRGAPLPDLELFNQFLTGERFYQLMQDYRHASIVPQGAVAERFEAVKAALLEAVRR